MKKRRGPSVRKPLWAGLMKRVPAAALAGLCIALAACATPPPAPATVSRLSVAPALASARDVSGASDRIADGVARQQGAIARQGTAIERQRALLERARRLIDGKTVIN